LGSQSASGSGGGVFKDIGGLFKDIPGLKVMDPKLM